MTGGRRHTDGRLLADFFRAEYRGTAAVAASLAGHQDAAFVAGDQGRRTHEPTNSIRAGIAIVLATHEAAVDERVIDRSIIFKSVETPGKLKTHLSDLKV
jgi:hypothetical protein